MEVLNHSRVLFDLIFGKNTRWRGGGSYLTTLRILNAKKFLQGSVMRVVVRCYCLDRGGVSLLVFATATASLAWIFIHQQWLSWWTYIMQMRKLHQGEITLCLFCLSIVVKPLDDGNLLQPVLCVFCYYWPDSAGTGCVVCVSRRENSLNVLVDLSLV